MLPHDHYVTPVGFAKEPAAERKRWIGRIFLALFVVLIAWLLLYRVVNPPSDNPVVPPPSTLPGPI